jgi:hypothetical protein
MLLSQPISEINTIYNIMDKKDLSNAIYTYQASKYYNVNSRLLANLINSESGYKNVSHSLSYVKGMSGINEKVWKIPNRTDKEQIYAGAFVFRKYLDKYKENELEALHGYKGRSNLGKRQALLVYKKYKDN